MTVRSAIGIAALACLPILVIAALLNQAAMVEAVNENLAESAKFEVFPPRPDRRHKEFQMEYQRLFPGRQLRRKARLLIAGICGCLFVVIWSFAHITWC